MRSHPMIRSAKGPAAVIAALMLSAGVDAGAPISGAVYVSDLGGPLYRVRYAYDGVNSPTLGAAERVATLPRGGGARGLRDGRVAVVGAGIFSIFDPRDASVVTVGTMTNANALQISPDGSRMWTGWKDTVLSDVPLAPLAPGTPRALSGDDLVATMLAFTPSGGVFYTTGGEFAEGNFGRIDLATFSTTRIATGVFATGVVHDRYSGTLITAGIGRATQRATSAPDVILSRRDDAAAGENYLVLEPTGEGHLLGTRYGSEFRLIFIDHGSEGRIGAPSTRFFSLPVPDITNSSGGLALDLDLMHWNGFE
jgi:hypothetical protein